MYGPTQTTIWSSMKKIEMTEEAITIGTPIANTSFYVLNNALNILPCGVPGELYIGGAGLAKDYKNNPELTSQRFIDSPFPNSLSSKLYKTGDLVRCLPNGEFEYLGRLDYQVKIHGHRIELGEIEEALANPQMSKTLSPLPSKTVPQQTISRIFHWKHRPPTNQNRSESQTASLHGSLSYRTPRTLPSHSQWQNRP